MVVYPLLDLTICDMCTVFDWHQEYYITSTIFLDLFQIIFNQNVNELNEPKL